ncbi:MAG: SsrA-binding protein SmpB [Bacteroidetes bacterium]|nr:SsrA-binding protein SmpB [Bacteroidota bacterium]MXW84263.1 SsrA-binding protein SmpB [Rhodothermaceae bacterium]MDE2672682.1 SsrA-binding protein SmpB [Bacteroidota bacterium]MXX58170.1 SsrA-binding protein SmpB [Rhodothermaceae bacterium]MYD18202.1 SsrA-binding protein SmpB [Rhodothermaceae bacterium]
MGKATSTLASNRRARRSYHILDTLEAGLVLLGTEVKSIRAGRVSLAEAWCRIDNGEAFLVDAHISHYSHGNLNNHEPVRPRKLLLHRREIARLQKAVEQKGNTLIPLSLYLKNGRIKAEIGIARGKQLFDKRADMAERATKRQLERRLKQY